MEVSLGQQLREARLRKSITIEDAARATKIHRDRINDLENDTYGNFPSLAYARSFLVLYSKYLGVDISKFPPLEVGNPASMGSYQYLQSDGAQPARRTTRPLPPAKPYWIKVVAVFVAMAILGSFMALMVMNVARLRLDSYPKQRAGDRTALETPQPTATPSPTAEPTATPTPMADSPSDSSLATPTPALSLAEGGSSATGLLGVPTTTAEVRPGTLVVAGALTHGTEPAAPTPMPSAPAETGTEQATTPGDAAVSGTATPIPVAKAIPVITSYTEGPTHSIKVEVTRKTKVRITRDVRDSAPIFDGWLNPARATRKYVGRHFWIQTSDRDAVKVTVDAGAGRADVPTPSPDAASPFEIVE